MADDEIELEHIARNGDTILIVGTPADTMLLISSEILINASEVFAALLGPNFREGQETATKSKPREIKLPEDNGEAMSAMCKMVHGNNIDDVLPSRQLLAIAIVTDKYACVERLTLQWRGLLLHWLERRPIASMLQHARIVSAAALTHQPRSFKIATNRMIVQNIGRYSQVLTQDCGSFIQAKVLLALEEKRNAAYQKIATQLLLEGMPTCEDDSGSQPR